MIRPDWIAVDYGEARLTAWAIGPEGVLAEASAPVVTPSEATLLPLIGDWLSDTRQTTALICGTGLAPRRAIPCTPLDPASLTSLPCNDPRLRLRLVPGLQQATPPDLTAGAETRIAGALAVLGDFDGVICLPGPRGLWAHVSAGEVVSFQSTLTGTLFAALTATPELRGTIATTGWDEAAFASALSDIQSRPERLAARLATLSAEAALTGLAPLAAGARLWGLLIGAELAAARPYWLGQSVALVATPEDEARYTAALAAQGIAPRSLPAMACTIAGLAQLRA